MTTSTVKPAKRLAGCIWFLDGKERREASKKLWSVQRIILIETPADYRKHGATSLEWRRGVERGGAIMAGALLLPRRFACATVAEGRRNL
uniref:Uncharacterized protein n=1 Tax=Oryza barthii TaxID=65489 RepID=A0A0D3FTZ2_9ORYZ